MTDHKDILQELKDMNSPLADMPRSMPYAVPENYFGQLAYDITLLLAPDPAIHVSKTMPFAVEENYFANFAAQLNAVIAGEEASNTLPKTILPYSAPANYFDNLPSQILSRAKATNAPVAPKRIPLGSEIWRQVRWAAAAVLILGIGLGSLNSVMRQESPQAISTKPDLSQVSSADIKNYVSQRIDDFDIEMIGDNLTTNDISALANQLDEKEIKQYLNETGWERIE